MILSQTKQAKEKPVRRCDPDYAIELLRRMNLMKTWTKDKIALKNEVIRNLKIGKHVIFETNYGYYGISRVGQHYYDSLTKKKQGHMRPLAGRDILFVCIGSGMKAKRLYMATAIPIRKASKKKN